MMELGKFTMDNDKFQVDDMIWIHNQGGLQQLKESAYDALIFFSARKQAEELVKTAKIVL